ncbi:MAG: aldehyde dehydrogenase family protein, partial [Phycisphaerae bacterium]
MSGFTAEATAAREASRVLASTPTETKNCVLRAFADQIVASSDAILAANKVEMERARAKGLAAPKLKRLELSASSVAQLASGLRQVAELPDPVGTVTSEKRVPSGLRVRRVRVPLGVICMIYEARPGVTADAFALCFKSGNSCLLKGGREAGETSGVIAALARRILCEHGLPQHAITLVTSSDREELKGILKLDTLIDLVI